MAELNIDQIVGWLIDGKTYRQIANDLDVPLSTLHDFTSRDEHSARVCEALQISGDTYADKAEEVLKAAEGTKEELMRARELAQHYRWKAAKRYPKRYGDKLELANDPKNPLPAAAPVIIFKTEGKE